MSDQVVESLTSLASDLRRIANGRSDVEVSQFQFVGLDEIKKAYGSEWPKRRERVLEATRGYIRSRLGPNDVIVSGADGFLVVFGEIEGEIARHAGKAIAEGLNAHFMGEPDRPSPKIGVRQFSMPTEGLVKSLGHGEEEWSPLPEAIAAPAESELIWRYKPVWDVRREAVSRYYLRAHDAQLEPVAGYNFENISLPVSQAMKLDGMSLDLSAEALRKLDAEGGRALVGLTVHVSSLIAVENRGVILARGRELPSRLARYRVLRITGMNPGFPRLYLPEIVGTLKPVFPSIMLVAAWDEPDIRSMVATDPAGIAIRLPTRTTDKFAVSTSKEILARIRGAADLVHAANKPLSVVGEFGPALAMELIDAGADFLSSSAIWELTEEPETVAKWSKATLKNLAAASPVD